MKNSLILLAVLALPSAALAASKPAISLSANPVSIQSGGSSLITLIASGVDNCSLNSKPVLPISTTKVSPVPSSSAYPAVLYSATCYTLPNKGGTKVSAAAPVFILSSPQANGQSLYRQSQVAGMIVSIQNLLRQMSEINDGR